MAMIADLKALSRSQRNSVVASYLGWTLDAFDFFLLVFIIKDIAHDFGSEVSIVAWSITLTLAMRPIGALVFGRLADRYGRRPILMLDVLLFSVFELLTAFAPSLWAFFVLRALFGIAMGGEWGVGASLALETIPPHLRGVVSGFLQEGYASGYLLASAVFALLYSTVGWRGMFVVGVAPALLILYIRTTVEESPAWQRAEPAQHASFLDVLKRNAGLCVSVILLMTAFNFLSHGTQDLYPTFLEVQHGLSPHAVGTIAIVYNIGALLGGLVFGALSERIGRRRAIVLAALLVLPSIPLWAYGASPFLLAVGAFIMQFFVQGAWGVVPAHLNELSPEGVRGTFPGLTYQLGNLLAAVNAPIQAYVAESHGNDYAFAMAITAGIVAVAVAVLALISREAKGVAFGRSPAGAA